MKLTILFVTFAIIACNARPQQQQDAGANPNAATVTKNEFENIGVDGYKFGLVMKYPTNCVEEILI